MLGSYFTWWKNCFSLWSDICSWPMAIRWLSADTWTLFSLRNENIVFFQGWAGRGTAYLTQSPCARPSIITPLDLLGCTCLLNEDSQPLPFISKFPGLSQTPLEGGPGLDTSAFTHIVVGPTVHAWLAWIYKSSAPGRVQYQPHSLASPGAMQFSW